MFKVPKKIFIRLLTSIVNVSKDTKFVSLRNQKRTTKPILNNLHPNEYTQALRYYPFPVNLDRCVRSCNTLNDLSKGACVLDKTGDLNLSVFNIITGIDKSNILTKNVPCKCDSIR